MRLDQIRATIIETTADHWHLINEGAQFNYNLGTINDVATVAGYHSARAILRADVDIALEFGMTDDPFGSREDWTEEWSYFADSRIAGEYVDVFYRGGLVDRVHVASVDGHRAVLPLPHRVGGSWSVLDWPYQVARVVDGLTGNHSFEDYFVRSGIKKIPA